MSAQDDTGKLIAVIGDEDTVTGFILAGIGQKSVDGTNFLVVKAGAFCLQVPIFRGLHGHHMMGFFI
jgi:hypothetical protein